MRLSEAAAAVLQDLEARDARDLAKGTPKELRARIVTRKTGELLHFLVLLRRPPRIVELGTSAGYSAIWLASAGHTYGAEVVSVDHDPAKINCARTNMQRAGLGDVVDLRCGDATDFLRNFALPINFLFLDISAAAYVEAFEAARPNIAPQGIIVADGWGTWERWQSESALIHYFARVSEDPDFTTVVLPMEKGECLSVRR